MSYGPSDANPSLIELRGDRSASPPAPSDRNGPSCSCGAAPHATDPNRCARGHAIVGNQLPTVVGDHGIRFWEDHDVKQNAIVTELLRDIGYANPAEAPLTIRITAHSLAQSYLVNAAAYQRMVESGARCRNRANHDGLHGVERKQRHPDSRLERCDERPCRDACQRGHEAESVREQILD